MLGFGGSTLLGRSLRAMADLVFFQRIWTLLAKPRFWCSLLEPLAIFDLRGVESSSNMKWKANAKYEGALASKFLSGINLVFLRGPSTIFAL